MTAACPACSAAPLAIELARTDQAVTLSVPAMRCAACIRKIEDRLNALDGVREARVNLTLKRVSIDTALPEDTLIAALADTGYDAYAFDAATLAHETDATGRDLVLRVGVAGFAMMNVMLLSVAVWSGATDATRDLFHLISAAIALPAALFSAQPFFRNALTALRRARLNMDVPISLAILLAGGMSLYEALNGGAHAYFDAALSLTFFLLIGRLLEHRTRAAARSAAQELNALEVHTAHRKIGNRIEKVATSALCPGDLVMVPTGMRVPVDGTMQSAAGFTDRAFLTGESDPVSHTAGAALRAGEINVGAPFDMRTDAVGDQTQIREIARLVETAENARNNYTSLADRAAQIYAPAVHILAAATFLGWVIATGDARHALNVAIAVLIITCPCALGLAVPAVSTAAIGQLYRMGFLVKSGTALERLAEVDGVLLDKTGTLTIPGFDFDSSALDPMTQSVAKGLAQASSHPVSQALNRYLADISPAEITDIHEHPGQGVSGVWQGQTVMLGRNAAATGLSLQVGETTYPLNTSERIADGAENLARDLADLNLPTEILSGDTPAKTEALAQHLKIRDWHAGLTPQDKHDRVTALAASGQQPCMIGDGINDAAALAAAHASIAPGTALDAARNAADVVMLGNTLGQLPRLFRLCRKAVTLYKQNFAIACAYNSIAIPIAVAGYATPLAAALAMSLSSITVLLNATRARTVA